MKLVFLGPVTVAASFRDTAGYSFAQYLEEFGKAYSGAEHTVRKALFEAQLAKVNKHNEEYKADKHTWWAAINEFSDFKDEEWATLKTGKAVHQVHQHPFAHHLSSPKASNPSRVDWREKNFVTDVKNQGGCGSCWAFSAIEVVESHYMIATGETGVKLAPQAYVNCVENPLECGGTGGCEGATMELAFNMTATRGVPLESDLPYKGRDASCTSYPVAAKCDGYYKVPENDALALETAIATVGPVSVTVAANWGSYGGGVFEGGCSASRGCTLDHGVVAVGYDQDYWLVRNSWGTGWGERGYIRLSRKHDAETFTDSRPADGVACKPYPKSQIVGGESGVLFDTSYPTNVHKVSNTMTV
jgi:cathepsin L